ncbi:diaminopropionate ammonia-lyase [Abyssibius alkaniclasticus]|uniref:diaminopropionate ammonia-lyase n=1 Tax=Abyssibius alkaniclasticus TaxID=2881234 RepID=UPI002363D45B|nr:diaminopropionate ammonia-lyase [Abyssibius alkaniclasticus]UPH72595.1 diaminopropionate ammonia-lyase [Abyssibius alkaniclasticus]
MTAFSTEIFQHATLDHVAHNPGPGDAIETVLPRGDFAAAVDEIRTWPGYAPTPLHRLDALAARLGLGGIHYKDEGPRFGLGSFKALGGAYAALRLLQRELTAMRGHEVSAADIRAGRYKAAVAGITLVSATDGNHGRSLAWGAQMFGAPCRIYIHKDVSAGRADAMAALGAHITRIDGDYDASVARARKDAEDNGWFVVSDTSWPGYSQPPRDVMAGYGMMLAEVTAAMPTAPSHVFVQAGVGGLAAAVAAALVQHWGADAPRIVVVEPALAACLLASAKAQAARSVAIDAETIMAGLSCGEPSPLAWQILSQCVQDFLTIEDSLVPPTMRLLAQPLPGDAAIDAGESAVAGLAALIAASQQPELAGALGLKADSTVLLIGSEGVTDATIFSTIMAGV